MMGRHGMNVHREAVRRYNARMRGLAKPKPIHAPAEMALSGAQMVKARIDRERQDAMAAKRSQTVLGKLRSLVSNVRTKARGILQTARRKG